MSARMHVILVALSVMCVPLGARAQETSRRSSELRVALENDLDARRRAMARALFVDGVAQARAGNFERAADYFRRAHELRPAPGVAYNFASALVRLGRLVEASELLHWVMRHDGTTPEMRAAAGVTVAQIDARVARLRVTLTGAPDEVSLMLDDRPLELAALGVLVPVDPGRHVVAAWRDNVCVAQTELEVAEAAQHDVELAIPERAEASSLVLRADGGAQAPASTAPDETAWVIGAIAAVAVVAIGAVTTAAVVAAGQGDAPAPIPGTTFPAILEWH